MKIDNAPREPDPFDKADSPSAIMAYVFSKAGKEGLIAILSQIETDRETLERDAAELDAVGLPEVAAIVMEAAANALPANVMHCPYSEDDVHNYQSWQSYQRRHPLGPR
jgi:hypothetical protein